MTYDNSECAAPLDNSHAMLHGLRREVARESERKRAPRLLKFATVLLYLLPVPFILLHHPYRSEIRCVTLAVIFLAVITKTVLEHERRQHVNQKCALIQELRDDPRCVGLLAMIVHNRLSDEPIFYATLYLKNLLPRLLPQNTRDFTPQMMDATLRLLNSVDGELVIATLRGLEQVGDARALPPVTRLAEQTQNLSVQAAAQECLPALAARARQQAAVATLLRPSQASPAAPQTLLRSAPSLHPSDRPEHLLRSHYPIASCGETSL